ncbi:DNA methylase N-4/N-6 [Shewanella denitrificans OS217]|uniref:DNA methylase N-4/N-6 n=1 Tax=Shewanella denitrificans (strain OS217 / ATCC BAA-1090 / DSM 15013) TaxID=318161 RepID=Q12SH1_SHEDO|nr:DNA methyltransferase [Shewanella denitrificans]ABE53605.1 DNA methylase N-4/N-6 [Shewanella denitrificans OS217]
MYNVNFKKFLSLYQNPLPSTRSGPLFNAFSYPTKISPEAIAVFIASHTKPGGTVLDTFGGSGTTGLAALLCDKPTEGMKKMASDLGIEPEWGPRNAHIFEIGVLGSFVSNTLCNPPNPTTFSEAVKSLIERANKKLGWMYKAKDMCGNEGFIRHIIWSDVVVCYHCKTEVSYWDASVQKSPLALMSVFNCPFCKKECVINDCERALEEVVDDFSNKILKRKKRIPTRIYGQSGKSKWQREPNPEDLQLIDLIKIHPLPSTSPNMEIEWGDLYRSGYHKGISHLHHFYTRRNFIVIATLFELCNDFEEVIRDALRLLILSYNATHSTLMTRVVVKKTEKDFVLTGAQSGVLYVSGLPVEKNIFQGIQRKSTAFEKAFSLVRGSTSKVVINNSSSEKLSLPDGCIDYVFTDPPFGDYIPYAELNQINELWLGSTTNRTQEIIVSKAQGKGVEQYSQMMASVFSEIERVLKPEGLVTVVFHSAKSNIWQALTNAYQKAGLSVRATSVLDKLQASFKQVVSTVSVKGDPLLLLTKGEVEHATKFNASDIMDEILNKASIAVGVEQTSERLYSRFVSRCLELGIKVDIDAKLFYLKKQEYLKDK